MRALLWVFGLLFYWNAEAVVSVRIVTSSTNIPANFALTSDSLIIQNAAKGMRGVYVINGASTAVVLNCSASASVVPSNTSPQNIYVPATGAIALDNWPTTGVCYIKSDGSAISSGTVYVMLGPGVQ